MNIRWNGIENANTCVMLPHRIFGSFHWIDTEYQCWQSMKHSQYKCLWHRPHVAGYFRKPKFFPPFLKNLRPHAAFLDRIWPSLRSRLFSKTKDFLSVFKKNLRPYVAFSNRMCGRASIGHEPRHDVIVFESLRFRPSTRIHWISVFKTLHPGERIWKPPFSAPENAS